MSVTIENIRERFSLGAEKPSDPALSLLLSEGQRQVTRDGISNSDKSYDDLVTAYIGIQLEGAGIITGALASKAVGDVSVSFKTGNSQTAWLDTYQRILANERGMRARLQ